MKKFLALILTAVFMLSAMAFVGCTPTEPDPVEPPQAQTPIITMFMSSPMTVSDKNGIQYVEKTLTASIEPSTANQSVDWSVIWAEGATLSKSIVTDYITVTPESDGSTTAFVRCYKDFGSDNIIITVTTREGAYTADCVVSFIGIPTDISISTTTTYNQDAYEIGIGGSYTFNISPTNPFDFVSPEYNAFDTSIFGVGSFVLGNCYYYSQDGTYDWAENTLNTVSLDTLKNNFINLTYENGVITITTLKAIENYYTDMDRIDAGRTRYYQNKFKEYVDDCYFKLLITETKSGITKTINLRFNNSIVTNVNLNSSSIYF